MECRTGWQWNKSSECSGCRTPISRFYVQLEQGGVSCPSCFDEKFASRCFKCTKIIMTDGIIYKDQPWHRDCLTCTHCRTSLTDKRFTSQKNKPYCAECFGELFAIRCSSCNYPITGIGETKCICFEERYWHIVCFTCAACKTSLVGCDFIKDNKDIVCTECGDLIA